MLGLLRRLHRLHIQLALQADSSEEIFFPRVTKPKAKVTSFDLSEVTNAKIDEAVKKGQKKAKEMVEQLGMVNLFKKHLLWRNKISIVDIDGGVHKDASANEYDNDNDSDDDDDDDDDDDEEDVDSAELQPENVTSFGEDIPIDEPIQVSEDLISMTEHNVIDNALQQRFQQLPSSTIPMYEKVETR